MNDGQDAERDRIGKFTDIQSRLALDLVETVHERIAVHKEIGALVVINKTDENPGDALFEAYQKSGIDVLRVSALTGEGIDELKARLRGRVASFVAGAADRRRHVILLDVDRRASYDSYFNVQNEIVAAYNALRDAYAVRHYGRRYAACTPEQREAVRACYPQRITETTAGGGEGGAR